MLLSEKFEDSLIFVPLMICLFSVSDFFNLSREFIS